MKQSPTTELKHSPTSDLAKTLIDKKGKIYTITGFSPGHYKPEYSKQKILHTFCNVFLADFSSSVIGFKSLELWSNETLPLAAMKATDQIEKMRNNSSQWKKILGQDNQQYMDEKFTDAQIAANDGNLVVVGWKNPVGGGVSSHVAVIIKGNLIKLDDIIDGTYLPITQDYAGQDVQWKNTVIPQAIAYRNRGNKEKKFLPPYDTERPVVTVVPHIAQAGRWVFFDVPLVAGFPPYHLDNGATSAYKLKGKTKPIITKPIILEIFEYTGNSDQ